LLGDRWENDAFIRDAGAADEAIRIASKGMIVIWGSIASDPAKHGEDGRLRKYNAARIAADGQWVSNGVSVASCPRPICPSTHLRRCAPLLSGR